MGATLFDGIVVQPRMVDSTDGQDTEGLRIDDEGIES